MQIPDVAVATIKVLVLVRVGIKLNDTSDEVSIISTHIYIHNYIIDHYVKILCLQMYYI